MPGVCARVPGGATQISRSLCAHTCAPLCLWPCEHRGLEQAAVDVRVERVCSPLVRVPGESGIKETSRALCAGRPCGQGCGCGRPCAEREWSGEWDLGDGA